MQSYMLLIVIGLIGFFGYYFYVGASRDTVKA